MHGPLGSYSTVIAYEEAFHHTMEEVDTIICWIPWVIMLPLVWSIAINGGWIAHSIPCSLITNYSEIGKN